MTPRHAQLLVYGFGPDAEFEGGLVGALERIETGGALRVRDVLFLHSDADSGELSVLGAQGDGAGRIVAPLLDFRLDPAKRRRATERVLSEGTGGFSGEAIAELGRALRPGAALAAVLVDHVWAQALDDAVSRTRGTALANEFVDAAALAPELLAGLVPAR